MSRYVAPASRQASKICGLNRGSVAFSTASASTSRISATIDSWLDASIAAAANRSGSPSRSTTDWGRETSRSASVMRSKNERRWAIAAKAEPTPPVPTTRILIRGFYLIARSGTARSAGL